VSGISEQNADAVRRLLDGFNRGDFAALNELDPQVELQDEPRIPGASWNRGHQGAIDWSVKLWQSFGQLSIDAEPIVVGDCVVARWRAHGTGKRSGIGVDMDGYCVFAMRGGKVRRVQFYENEDTAVKAACEVEIEFEDSPDEESPSERPRQDSNLRPTA
jgi:ketosteroid isomerase-like protein